MSVYSRENDFFLYERGKEKKKEELPIVSLWFLTNTRELQVRPVFLKFIMINIIISFFFFSLVFFVFADLYTK